jgi:hypothetical protein
VKDKLHLLILCPKTSKPIDTGFRFAEPEWEYAVFEKERIHCPHCGETHVWSKPDAYLAGPTFH